MATILVGLLLAPDIPGVAAACAQRCPQNNATITGRRPSTLRTQLLFSVSCWSPDPSSAGATRLWVRPRSSGNGTTEWSSFPTMVGGGLL